MTGRAAFILLGHENLADTGAFARVLAEGGRPVAVHLDIRAGDDAPFREAAGPGPVLIRRRRCEWGMFGLVEATLDAARELLASGAAFSHVALVSGSCLPLRPLAEFDAFLAANPGADIFEAVPLARFSPSEEGLSHERFTLWHPFGWRRRRALFDFWVSAQRLLGVRRRRPKGLDIVIGSQWWCLSRETLAAILADPELPALMRFFRWSWIPDESLIQSLALRRTRNRIPRAPTFARFDERGAPYVLYDDHEEMLAGCDYFFARKFHPRARRLRARFLAAASGPVASAAFEGRAPEAALRAARESRVEGREALISPARAAPRKAALASGFPYLAVGGVGGAMAARISAALSGPERAVHGRLFAPGAVNFAGGAALADGALPADPTVRDLWPEQFVVNLARGAAMAGRGAGFCFSVEDRKAIGDFIAADPGVRIVWWRGGWALDLMEEDAPDAARAARLAAAEREMLTRIRKGGADLAVHSAALLIADPAAAIRLMGGEGAADFRPAGWARAAEALAAFRAAGAEIDPALIEAAS